MALVNYKEHVEHLELDGDDRLVLTIRSGQQTDLEAVRDSGCYF